MIFINAHLHFQYSYLAQLTVNSVGEKNCFRCLIVNAQPLVRSGYAQSHVFCRDRCSGTTSAIFRSLRKNLKSFLIPSYWLTYVSSSRNSTWFSKPILLVSDNAELSYRSIYCLRNLELFKLVFHQSIQSRLAYQWQGYSRSCNAFHLLYQLSLNSCST